MNGITPDLLKYLDDLRKRGVKVASAGGKDLDLPRPDFEAYMSIEVDGARLLSTLESVHREAEKLGLVKGRMAIDGVRFKVPDWQALVDFLRMAGG